MAEKHSTAPGEFADPSAQIAEALRDLLHQVEHQERPEFVTGRARAAIEAWKRYNAAHLADRRRKLRNL